MPCSARGRRPQALLSVTLVLTVLARPARAQEASSEADAEACFDAAEKAQPLMRQKKLHEARAQLEMCARDVCPRVARADCRDWLTRLAVLQPSIVISAHETRGNETRDVYGVRLIIDDAIVVGRVDSKPIEIDPGPHRLRLERSGVAMVEQDVSVEEGDKARVVDVYWHVSDPVGPPHPDPVPSAPTPSSVYVLGALGLGVLGAGTYFEVAGLSRRSQLDGSCKTTRSCASSEVDTARNLTRAGDVALGAGALMLVGAAIVYFTRPAVASRPRHEEEVGWTLAAAPGGFIAGVQGHL